MWKSQNCSQSSKEDWLLTRGWQDLQWERVIARGLTLHGLIGGSGSGHWQCLGYCTIPCPLEAGWGMPWRHSASELQSWVSSTEACWLLPLSCTQDWGSLFFFFFLNRETSTRERSGGNSISCQHFKTHMVRSGHETQGQYSQRMLGLTNPWGSNPSWTHRKGRGYFRRNVHSAWFCSYLCHKNNLTILIAYSLYVF